MFGVMEKSTYLYGTHLIDFGIWFKLPDAVKLGEEIALINKEIISDEQYNALNMFKLDNPPSDHFKETRLKSLTLSRKADWNYQFDSD